MLSLPRHRDGLSGTQHAAATCTNHRLVQPGPRSRPSGLRVSSTSTPAVRFVVGIAGHRGVNSVLATQGKHVAAALAWICAEIGKLVQVEVWIGQLLAGPDTAIDCEGASRRARWIDSFVVGESESWQAVCGGKPIALPA